LWGKIIIPISWNYSSDSLNWDDRSNSPKWWKNRRYFSPFWQGWPLIIQTALAFLDSQRYTLLWTKSFISTPRMPVANAH